MSIKVIGEVTSGNRIGRRLGFPTANIPIPAGTEIRCGVYAARVTVGGESFGAMVNVGKRPSVDGHDPVIEAHLFGFEGDLYGKQIELELLRHIRDERKFPDLESLTRQISEDRITILDYLGEEDRIDS